MALFRQHEQHLRAATARPGVVSQENVEDACAYAWMQLFHYQPNRETVFGWLLTVSRREAWRLHQLERGHHYEAIDGPGPELLDKRDVIAAADEVLDARDRLEALSPRGRVTMFLRGAGFTNAEIGRTMSVSPQRVQALQTRARFELRRREMQTAEEGRDVPPPVKLLNELRRNPPVFIRRELGRSPQPSPKGGGEDRRLQWSRLAMRIVRYRADNGIDDPLHAFGQQHERATDPVRVALQRDVDAYRRGRHREPPGQGLGR